MIRFYFDLANRCYKYYSTSKNQSAARADCRKDQADLYSWRDNTDENELITALLIAQTKNQINVNEQEYAWSSGIVHHGSDIDYAVTWLDPKAPTLQHPNMKNTANIGFCNQMTVFGYDGYTEPTQIIRADETEDCISFVFVPQTNSRGQVCLADDYCSTEMNYICEFSKQSNLSNKTFDFNWLIYFLAEASITGESFVPTSRSPPVESSSTDVIIPDEDTPSPSALTDSLNMSNVLIYGVILIVIFLIFGIVSYIIIRKRKQKADNPFATSQQNSTNNSIMSETESSENP